jgi:hypothetical protein
VEAPAPAPAPGEVEVWAVAVELVVGTEVPPDVPPDVVVGAVVGAVVVVVEVVTVEVDVECVAVGCERVMGGGAAEDELDVFASEPPPQAPIATAAATVRTPPPVRGAARLTTPRLTLPGAARSGGSR